MRETLTCKNCQRLDNNANIVLSIFRDSCFDDRRQVAYFQPSLDSTGKNWRKSDEKQESCAIAKMTARMRAI